MANHFVMTNKSGPIGTEIENTLTDTLDAISHPAIPAPTLEASGNVDTCGVHVTVMGSDLTLINICECIQKVL